MLYKYNYINASYFQATPDACYLHYHWFDLVKLDFTQYPPWDYGGQEASRS